MQDSANQDAACFLSIKHHVLALLHAAYSRANFLTRTAHPWIAGKHLTAILELADVPISLVFAPSAECVDADAVQIVIGAA